MSVLGNVEDAWSHLETSQSPNCLLSWVDKLLLPLPKTHLWWVAGAAVVAASAQVWAAALRAHRVLRNPADGESRSGGEAGEAVSSYAETHSCQTTAHCCGCWLCLRLQQCYPHWGIPSHYPLEEGILHYC